MRTAATWQFALWTTKVLVAHALLRIDVPGRRHLAREGARREAAEAIAAEQADTIDVLRAQLAAALMARRVVCPAVADDVMNDIEAAALALNRAVRRTARPGLRLVADR